MRPASFALLVAVVACGAGPNAVAAPIAPAAAATSEILARLPDGRRLLFRCMGVGGPTILLEAGFAATSGAWFKVQPLLARSERSCAYDRAGLGRSDPGPEPRDAAAIARDLDQGLRAARIAGPFILVGHSAGALYVRQFAALRRGEIAGMVLVDPSVEHQDRRLDEALGPGAGDLSALRAHIIGCIDEAGGRSGAASGRPGCGAQHAAAASVWRTQLSELDNLWGRTSDEVAAAHPGQDATPLLVLTAGGRAPPSTPGARRGLEAWRALHAELAVSSSRGAERLVPGSSHMMMFDRPDAIVSAVADINSEYGSTGR
jgi:pimeloyl-ACP methyl ester carboxylesterase